MTLGLLNVVVKSKNSGAKMAGFECSSHVCKLCVLEPVTYPLCVSIVSSIGWR